MKRRLSLIAILLPACLMLSMAWVGYDINTARELRTAWNSSAKNLSAWQSIRLYYSKEQDDYLYYEYASLMVGAGTPHITRYAPWIQLYRPVSSGTGALPYLDFHGEYPPVAFAAMLPPRLGKISPQTYHRLFGLEMALTLYAALWLALQIRRRHGDIVAWSELSLFAAGAVFLIGPLIIQRFDLIPAVIVLCTYAAFARGYFVRAGIWTTVGAATKIYPLILAPLPVVIAWCRNGLKSATQVAMTILFGLALWTIPFWILAPGGFLDMFRHHTDRGLEIESLASLILQIWNWVHPGFLAWVSRSMSDTVVGGPSGILARAALPLMILTLCAVYYLLWKRRMILSSHPMWLFGCVVLTLAFVIPSPIASPQFVIWFFPLACAAPGVWGHRLRLSYLAYAAATQFQFDGTYHLMHRLHPLATAALLLRWSTCALFAWIACRALRDLSSLELRNLTRRD